MLSNLRLLPNQLTAIRFLAVPIMWVFALQGQMTCLGIGLTVSLVTDLLDGAVARKLNQSTEFGSKFDSLADQCLQLSALLWVIMLMPGVFTENPFISTLAVSMYIASLGTGLIKFKRLANLHLYLSKIGGLFLYIFLIASFLAGEYDKILFLLAGILFALSSAETLILQLTSTEVDSQMGSFLFRYVPIDHPVRYWFSRLP